MSRRLSDVVRRIRRIVQFAKIVSGDDGDDGSFLIQRLQTWGPPFDAALWEPVGFHAVPRDVDLAVKILVGGNEAARLYMASSAPDRPPVAQGEVSVYHPATGSKIHFLNDSSIRVESSLSVTVDTPSATFTGNVQIDGDLTVPAGTIVASGEITSGTVTLTGHVHPQGDDARGDAQVDTGSGVG